MITYTFRGRAALALALVAAGCSPDPVTGTLPTGSRAVVAEADGALLTDPSGRDIAAPPLLPPGVVVRVGADPGQTDTVRSFRPIRVVVESGEFSGRAGLIPREQLRPIED